MDITYDYYHILEVPRTASADEIKQQYRKLILKFHPDRNKTPLANEASKRINEAYDILSDPQKKYDYDQYDHTNIDVSYYPSEPKQNFTYQSYKPGFIDKNRRILNILKQIGTGVGFLLALAFVILRIATWFY